MAILFSFSVYLVFLYNELILWYQIIFRSFTLHFINANNIMNLDGFAVSLILSCVFLPINCLLIYWFLRYENTRYCSLLLLVSWLLINSFSSSDLLMFYIYFESIVIPMFLVIVFGVVDHVRYTQHIIFYIYTLWFYICITRYYRNFMW